MAGRSLCHPTCVMGSPFLPRGSVWGLPRPVIAEGLTSSRRAGGVQGVDAAEHREATLDAKTWSITRNQRWAANGGAGALLDHASTPASTSPVSHTSSRHSGARQWAQTDQRRLARAA